MQMLLSFAQKPSYETEPSPCVWPTLGAEQQNETLALLARLLAKAAAENTANDTTAQRKKRHDD